MIVHAVNTTSTSARPARLQPDQTISPQMISIAAIR